MDTVSERDGLEECFSSKEKLDANFQNEEKYSPKNPLLHLFVQFAWDPTHGQYCEAKKYRKIENWLEFLFTSRSTRIPRLNEGYYMSGWPENSDGTVTQDIPDREDRIILGNLARKLRMIEWLVKSKGDVNYINNQGRTVLHEFFHRRIKIKDQSKIQDLMKGLVAMKAPFHAMDFNWKTPFDLAAAPPRDLFILQTMVESLVDDEKCTKNGDTALHILVNRCFVGAQYKDSYVVVARTLLANGANVNAKNNKGLTPVHLAAQNLQTDMLRLFADRGANFNVKTNDDETSLHTICKSMDYYKNRSKIVGTFDFLVSQGCDVEAVAKDNYKPLHFATEFSCVGVVERLIALGVKVDCRTEKTLLTPLYLAAKVNNLEIMKVLVRAGADVNAEAADGSTPIFMSVMRGDYRHIQYLMDQGADLYRRDSLTGFTLLHVAAHNTSIKLGLLIDKGLDVNDAAHCGVTPLQVAAVAPNFDAVKLLLARGAEVDLQASQWTALHLASIIKSVGVVKILVANGADVNRRGGTGRWTPLHLAVIHRNFAVGVLADGVEKDDVRFSCPMRQLRPCTRSYKCDRCLDVMTILIDKGADVNAENGFGETPLHLVSTRSYLHREMEKLLKAGAHVNVQDRKGRLLVHDVCECDGPLKLLLEYGADINDDDTSESIVNSWEGVKNVAIKHAIKLKLVGLPIAKVYEPLIDDPDFADFHEQCSKEAIQLKNHRDTDGFSLYGFLKMDPKFQYHFDDKISRDFKNLEELFPLYAGLIRGACRESAFRRQLLEPARIIWAENSGVYLPDVWVERILSYLSNRYLKVMTTNVEEVVAVEDKRIAFLFECNGNTTIF